MIGISINLCPSKVLAGVVTLMHLGAVLCVVLVHLPILLILIGWSYYFTLKRYVLLRSNKSIVKIWHKEANIWYLLNNVGKVIESKLRADSFISRYLLLLNFKIPVILCADAINKDKLRELRVHLLTQRGQYV